MLILAILACSSPATTTDSAIDTALAVDDTADSAIDTASCTAFKAYSDVDGDGYGDINTVVETCTLIEGQVKNHKDCDDGDPDVYQDAPELCDGLDNDCDGTVDNDPVTGQYFDGDGDGYGDPAFPVPLCEHIKGYVSNAKDCDDSDADVHPGAPEHCDLHNVSIDENCDGDPEADAVDPWAWYPDADGDGSSTADEDVTPVMACPDERPMGYNTDHADCNDNDPTVSPNTDEICDGLDQNCDGMADNNAVDAPTWYPDNDGDGPGDPYGYFYAIITSCEEPTSADVVYVTDGTDCYDFPEDPFSALVHPGAEEVCDWTDNDCDGFVDDEDPEGVVGTSSWYADMDGDMSGGETLIEEDVCEYGAYVLLGLSNVAPDDDDCDDSNVTVYPGAVEICDNLDNDCDGSVDEISVP